jgi:hypothetical protein
MERNLWLNVSERLLFRVGWGYASAVIMNVLTKQL